MTIIPSSNRNLLGKTILITGASSGIGLSTAFEFARSCCSDLRLILTARRLDVLKRVAREINDEVGDGVRILCAEMDVSCIESVKGFVRGLRGEKEEWREWRDVWILINNAGLAVGGMAGAPDLKEEDIDIMFRTNVLGLIQLTQLILPIFLARSPPAGDIINLNSIAGREPYPGGSTYCATKAAVAAISGSLRRELVGTKVRVMEVAPGQVETGFSVVRFGGDEERAKNVYRGVEPLTADDVAEIVVFMATRRERAVVADVLVFPNHQASATVLHRKQ